MALMLNRLTLRQKFLLLPVLLCLGLALLFVLHGVNSRRQQADLDFVRQQGLSQLETSQNLLARQEQIVNLLNSAATTGDADALALAKTLHGQQSQALAALQNADGVAADVREASQASAQYFAQAYQMAEQMAAGKLDMARAAEHAQALKSTRWTSPKPRWAGCASTAATAWPRASTKSKPTRAALAWRWAACWR